MKQLSKLETEKRNNHSLLIDNLSTREILEIINNEDLQVAQKVRDVLPEIELAVQIVYTSFQNGGSLFYVGAGTSGRIGVLDAVECPPTFSTPPDFVQAIIAGGNEAFMRAKEGVEDNEFLGGAALKERGLKKEDVVIGIAASGRTPFVVGALKYARQLGAKTISL